MKNWLKITLTVLTAVILTGGVPEVLAEIKFSGIEIRSVENGTAKLKWTTPGQLTKGMVYFGNDPDNLNRWTGYSAYDYYHEVALTSLRKNKTYYYRIVAIDKFQNETEAFTQSFSTKNMKREETVKPEFKEQKILQATNSAVALAWTTNEETNAVVYYGVDPDNLKKTAKYKSYRKEHELLIHKLKPGEKYYLKITAKDKSGNKSSKFLRFNTHDYEDAVHKLNISNVAPLSFDEKMIFSRKAIIEWKTNLVAKSSISYGVKPGKYKKKITVSKSRRFKHQAALSDLEPNTTYYYKISAYDSLHKKKTTSKEMSVTTRPLKRYYRSGSLVQSSGGYKVYVIKGADKFWIKTADVFVGLGYRWDWIEKVDDVFLNEYSEGKSVTKTEKHPNGTLIKYARSAAVYLLENGRKRPFSSAGSFVGKGYDWNRIITISKKEKYKTGEYL